MSTTFQQQREGVDVRGGSGVVARYFTDPDRPKPCFHPLRTPKGHRLTGFEMSDHVWHRGLWFTIKFVNGTNFWEEHPPFGVQAEQAPPRVAFTGPDDLSIQHTLTWTSDATGPIIQEARSLTLAGLDDGVTRLDWRTELTPTADVTLDRTPFTTWGGYGGLSFRGARELHNASFLLPGGEQTAALAGDPHDWVVMQASVDGGADQRVALGMIDHPGNIRSPSPWYAKSGPGFTYLNAAFLFHESLALPAGQPLALRYRVLFRDGEWTAEAFAELARQFREEA